MRNCLSCGCPLTTKKLGEWVPGEGFTCKECSSRRTRKLARVDGGIRRHHRQQIITIQLTKLKYERR